MNRTQRIGLCVATLVAATVINAALAQTARRGSNEPAELAPEDALVFVGITDVHEFWTKFQKTSGYRLLNDPIAKEVDQSLGFLGPAVTKAKERLAATLDVQAEQLRNPFAGALGFYLLAPPGGGEGEPEFGLVAHVGDQSLMTQYFDKIVNRLKESGRHETEAIGSHTLHTFEIEQTSGAGASDSSPDEFESFDQQSGMGPSPNEMIEEALDEILSSDSLPERLAMCLLEDRVVISSSSTEAKAAIRRLGPGRTLAETDDYKSLKRHLRPVGSIRMLINLPRIIELAKATTDESEAQEFRDWLRVIGAQNLRSVVGHLRLGASSYDNKFDLLFLMSGERSGLAKILSMENSAVAPPTTVATSACAYAGVNLNIPRLLDEVERMVRQTDPQAADEMRASLENVTLPGNPQPVNLRQTLLQHLTGPLNFTLDIMSPLAPGAVRPLLTLGHRDQNAVVRFCSSLAEAGFLAPRDLRGTQVFDVVFPPGVTIAAASDRLLVGTTVAVEAGLIGEPTEPLAQTDIWHKAARYVPEEAWLTLFIDERKILSTALDMAENSDELMGAAMLDPGLMMISMVAESMGTDLDAEGIENARRLLKYAAPSIITVATTPEGVRVTQVEMNPIEE
jgi:hypothetical protein